MDVKVGDFITLNPKLAQFTTDYRREEFGKSGMIGEVVNSGGLSGQVVYAAPLESADKDGNGLNVEVFYPQEYELWSPKKGELVRIRKDAKVYGRAAAAAKEYRLIGEVMETGYSAHSVAFSRREGWTIGLPLSLMEPVRAVEYPKIIERGDRVRISGRTLTMLQESEDLRLSGAVGVVKLISPNRSQGNTTCHIEFEVDGSHHVFADTSLVKLESEPVKIPLPGALEAGDQVRLIYNGFVQTSKFAEWVRNGRIGEVVRIEEDCAWSDFGEGEMKFFQSSLEKLESFKPGMFLTDQDFFNAIQRLQQGTSHNPLRDGEIAKGYLKNRQNRIAQLEDEIDAKGYENDELRSTIGQRDLELDNLAEAIQPILTWWEYAKSDLEDEDFADNFALLYILGESKVTIGDIKAIKKALGK